MYSESGSHTLSNHPAGGGPPGRRWRAGAFGVLWLAAILFSTADAARAGDITALVVDAKGQPLKNAVVYAIPVSGKVAPPEKGKTALVDQIRKEFIPMVVAAQTGTAVYFPNNDNIHHHVYSLSPAKTFELPLYLGAPPNPVVFDKPGIAALGCNIHDWMLAYVVVVDTPHFAITGQDGKGAIRDVPPGAYTLLAWHYMMKGEPESRAIGVQVASGDQEKRFALDLKPVFPIRRAPSLPGGGYR